MYLDEINDILLSNSKICSEEIKSISIKKVYYLVTGRNAWHSTWVQHFYKNCISTEYRELENDAEKRRGAGTVFYIEELPVLCFEVSTGCLVVSEINTNFPLKNYDPNHFLKIRNQCNYTKKINCPSEQVFIGNRLSIILQSLNSIECWNNSIRKDSLFKLFLIDSTPADFEAQSDYYLIRNSSTTGGKKNSLSWVMKTGNISSEYVKKLAAS